MNDIKSFKPFLAVYTSYSGDYEVIVRFTCKMCGSHDITSRRSKNFFEGHFSCGKCGYSVADDGYPINYYSSCFHKFYQPLIQQLTLF